MITETSSFHCPKCQSTHVVKNGKNKAGSQQFLCRACGTSAVLYPRHHKTEMDPEQILAAYHERPSMRGIARVFHISRNTVKDLLKKKPVSKRP